LRGVQRGEEWLITERGKPIARLIPFVEPSSIEDRLQRLIEAGVLEPPAEGHWRVPKPIKLNAGVERDIAQRFLQEDRGER
jgi:antitoxin (DNA-binding transcriptional repressor) of toxin-antitoxin stability system